MAAETQQTTPKKNAPAKRGLSGAAVANAAKPGGVRLEPTGGVQPKKGDCKC